MQNGSSIEESFPWTGLSHLSPHGFLQLNREPLDALPMMSVKRTARSGRGAEGTH